jgi:hypothetical protein
MEWWSGSTATLKTHSERGPPTQTGISTCPGSSSVFELRHARTQASRRQNLCMAVLFLCLTNFCPPPSRRQACSSANCSHCFPAWPTALAVPRRQQRRLQRSALPHWSTCGPRPCRRACRPPIAVPTASGCPAPSIS